MEVQRITEIGGLDNNLFDTTGDNSDANTCSGSEHSSDFTSDSSFSLSDEDIVDTNFEDVLAEVVDSCSSDQRIENIVRVLTSEIEFRFDHFFCNFIFSFELQIRVLRNPELFGKEEFRKFYTSELRGVYFQLTDKIDLGVSYIHEHEQDDWLEQLERVLDETFESYREQEKIDVLFEDFKQVYRTDNAAVNQDPLSFDSAADPENPDGATAADSGQQLGSVLDAPGVGTILLQENSTVQLGTLDDTCHERAGEQEEIVDFGRIWNHFTISRDETSANNFARELLYAILSRHMNSESGRRHDPFASETTTKTVIQYNQDQTTQLEAPSRRIDEVHQQRELPEQDNWSLLDAQNVRLRQTRQNMLLDAASRQTLFARELSTSESITGTNMIQESLESEALPDTGSGNTILHGNDVLDPNARKCGRGETAIDHQSLKHRIASLEQENKRLKTSQSVVPRCQVLYFIKNEGPPGVRPMVPSHPGMPRPAANTSFDVAYLDEPTWSIGPTGEIMLRANFPIPDVNGFLRQRTDIAFVVSHYYSQKSQQNEVQDAARAKRVLPQPEPISEILRLHSPDMIEAVESFLALQPNFSKEFPSLNIRGPLHAPYMFWYHYRSPTALDVLGQSHRDTMQLLTAWIEERYAKKFDRVDDQLKRGVISEDTMPFLVKPGNVLVWKEHHEINAVVAKSWPVRKTPLSIIQGRRGKEQDWTSDEGTSEKRKTVWIVGSWSFKYDGRFYQKERPVEIILSSDQVDDEIRIKELNIYPLDYAESQFKAALETRGNLFWKCRHQNLVSYENLPGENQRDEQNNGERFMIDFETYRQLHSSSTAFKMSYPSIDDEKHKRMDSDTMESDEPPSAPQIYVFPNTIPGYNLRSKKWVDLKVDMIRDVTWNKKSFDHLVVDEETRELVQALVEHQIAGQKSTDIIDRKGNGLIILLHGGPGTGKTFTAESVAEMAEKPLFRITCGDIGTEPEKVENYLDSVLHLGKIWDCIVLIDEAEVFLEQRNLNNLERNALVSVFLRVLEYYEGILILTSNRVGTFDEAFKSRILLSLHYDNLGEGQRTKIWKNFFKRLKELEDADNRQETSLSLSSVTELGTRKRKSQGVTEGVDFDDVECYITELAKHELNGRQIRNVITTARQLAVSRNQLMGYEHLKHVIKVSSKFDNYLKTVREGFSDDQVARDEGIR